MFKWFPVLAGALALLWFWMGPDAGTSERAFGGRPTPVNTVIVNEEMFADRLSAVGTLDAWESVDIRSSVSQIVTDLKFEDGDIVSQGDVLAVLKQDAEQARLSELSSSLADAKREVKRLRNLAERNQVAQTDLDRATTRVEVLFHQLEEVQARLRDRTIIAPFSGQLGLREVSPGALITQGTRITTLDDLSRMRLKFSVPATELGVLSVGQSIVARSAAFDQEFQGLITAIDSRVDPITRSVQVRAELPNDSGLLKPGLLMNTRVVTNPRRTLLIPEQSLESRASNHYVWRIKAPGQAEKVQVEIGSRSAGVIEILAGLRAGDEIVIDGVGSLRASPADVRVGG